MNLQAQNETVHGEFLAKTDTEKTWGWGTPAGIIRAHRRARMITEGACLSSNTRILEIGCGTGMFTEIFSKSGANILAVDISCDLLEKAKKRKLPENKVQFFAKRFEDCDVDGPFDAVIGSSVLHHLQIQRALEKIFTLLKPGGLISFAEPNMLNPQVFIERKFRSFFPYVSIDETAFVRKHLKNLLKRNGFEEIEIIPFDWLHPATPGCLVNIFSLLSKLIEKIPLIKEFSGSLYIRAKKPLASN